MAIEVLDSRKYKEMSNADDALSDVFGILRHPIRRKIVLLLSTGPKRYSDIIKGVDLYTGHLYYHLNAVKVMIKKTDGFYELNELGFKAVELMREIDSTQKTVDESKKDKSDKEVFNY